MKVLYLEDDFRDADLTRRELGVRAPHIELDIASTLASARALLDQDEPYDLVLTDLGLPDGSGLDLVMELREQERPVAIVVLTGDGSEEVAIIALKAGADDYLVKRDNYLARLPLLLETALKRSRTEAARRERPLRVLYAEHNEADADLMCRHLNRNAPHIHIEVVYTATELLRRLPLTRVEPCPIDVILLDYRLPGLNALEALKTLRQERGLDLPVVIVTGQGDQETAVQALRLGAADYVVKGSGYLLQLPPVLENAYHYTQLRREQAALHESEARYRRLAENAPDILFRCQLYPQAQVEYISPAVTKMTGYSPEELYANSMLLFEMVHQEDRSIMERVVSGEPLKQPLIVRWITKDGELVWGEHRFVLVHDDVGNITALEGIVRDVTERRMLEQAEHEQRALVQALLNISKVIGNSLDFGTVMTRILENVGQVVPHDAANIMLIERDRARMVAWRGYPEELAAVFDSFSLPMTSTKFRQMERSSQPLLIEDTDQFEGWVRVPETAWVRSYIAVPIRVREQVMGFLNLDSRTPSFFNDEHVRRLEAFAAHIAIALENAQLYEEVRNHAAELEQRVEERTIELNQAKERVEVILNNSSDVIMLAQVDGTILQVNPVFLQMFGREPDTILGRPLTDLVVEEDAEHLVGMLNEAVNSGHPQRTDVISCFGGDAGVETDIVLSPVRDKDGQTIGVVCSLRDITEHKQRENQLQKTLEREVELNELKSRFVSIASHEFRTPLAVIQAANDLLARYYDRMSNEQRLKEFNQIRESISNMVELLDDVLLVTKSEAGKLDFHPESLDVGTFCQDLIARYQQAHTSLHTFIFEQMGECVQVSMDPKLLRNILGNLLSNAIKYSPSESTITLTLDCQDDRVTFSVQDDGIGIPNEDQPRIFEAFHRATNVGIVPGTGLGMAIVKQAVDLHGGTVTFQSEENIGTLFTVTLPARPADENPG